MLTIVTHAYSYEFYSIRSTEDWIKFRDAVDAAKGQYDVNARLEADITTNATIGWTEATAYRGNFDGNGYTLNVNYDRNSNKDYSNSFIAPFRYVSNATITDLHVTGKINGDMHPGGLVGCAISGNPTIRIERVWVSTEVTSSTTHAGGIIGHSNTAHVFMSDCRFDGRVITNQSENSFAGEIIGWANNGGSWHLNRVYDKGWPNAKWMFYCLYYLDKDRGWTSWGQGSDTFTVSQHGWTNVDYYNIADENEAIRLLNGNQADTWTMVNGKAVPVMGKQWLYLSSGSSSGKTLKSGYYYITKDISFKNNNSCNSGLSIADGATVHIYIPKGVTLTAQGGNASGRSGAGAGIYLPKGSTLFLEGGGTVDATGGDAANGGNGKDGGNATADESNHNWIEPGDGGAGGDGGGGAGAGIGTKGGTGGAGGRGVSKGIIEDYSKTNYDGIKGNTGGSGGTSEAMGSLFVDQSSGLSVIAKGGKAGSANGSAGSTGYRNLHNSTTYDYALGGGSGGGGGGYGGAASSIGTGGPGGGGGGSGSTGTTRWCSKWASGWFSVGSKGGKGGQDGNGNWASNASDAVYYGSRGWEAGDNRASGGSGGGAGNKSTYLPYTNNYLANFKVDGKSATIGYKSNVTGGRISVTVPPFCVLGITDRDKYVIEWKVSENNQVTILKVNDEYSIKCGTTDFKGEWKSYQDIFPEGYGTKGAPFVIEEGNLFDFVDYVNNGGNTRGLYFRQKGDFVVQDVLPRNNRGSKWTPIGHTYIFEGDYDGGGNRIRSGEIDNIGDAVGIFGKVSGCIHHLGVENITINNNNSNARCGTIAGRLLGKSDAKPDQPELTTAGEINNCYAANNTVNATYGGGLVGEMANDAKLNYDVETGTNMSGSHNGGLASIINNSCKVDMCFSSGNFSSNGYNSFTNSIQYLSAERMKSGEITWMLNNKTAFGVAWFQNIDKEGQVKDDYPVLDSIHSRVYANKTTYTNVPTGTLFALSGMGLPDNPFLINSIDDWNKVADFCNGGQKITAIHFLQTADFDLKGNSLTPIGNHIYSFDGYYDGGGHTIRNGIIEKDTLAGVFGLVSGTVTRLGVENMTIRYMKTDGRSGGIAARLTGNGVISNCLVKKCQITSNSGYYPLQGVSGGIASDMFGNSVIRNCLVVNTTLTATRTGYICSDTKAGTSIIRCFTDGNSLVSYDNHGTTSDCGPNTDVYSLANGSITYILNDRNNSNPEPNWYQNITGDTNLDETPVLSSNRGMVFYRNGVYTNDSVDISRLGKGTEAEPYKIGTPEELQDLILHIGIAKRSDYYIKQTADINMADSLMVPIGTCTDGFEGHYDGGGHVIKNVNMSSYQGNSMGLFNNIKGVVENLGIENSTFKAEGTVNRIGAFAGKLVGQGVLRNCYVKGSTVDFNQTAGVVVGALVGEQTDTTRIESCYGYKNTVTGQNDGLRHYGYIVGYIGSTNAKDSLVFTDGANLCADKQRGAENIVRSERDVTDLRFNSGEICYLLNLSSKDYPVWGQAIRTDLLPVFNINKSASKRVYRHTNDVRQVLYTNSDELPYSVLVTLDPNHSEMAEKTFEVFKADDKYYVPDFMLEPQAVEWNNYYFAGWTTEANGKGTFYPQDGVIAPSSVNVKLYALWDIKVPDKISAGETTPVVTLQNLRKDTIVYKVYDFGGADNPYGYGYNGKLTLKAPAGHFIRLTGTITTESLGSDNKPRDYMIVYDSDKTRLTNEQAKSGDSYSNVFFSTANGTKEDIGRLMSSGNEMTIEFITDGENCYDGLDLTVTVLPEAIRELGAGSKDEPFEVFGVEDLRTVDQYIQLTGDSKVYILQGDSIDMEGQAFTPIASSVKSFEGHYDGGGYIIRNMKIDADPSDAVGFFRHVSGVVERIGIEKSTLKGLTDTTTVGVIAGRLSGNGQVRYCYAKDNNITYDASKGAAGALVGEQADTTHIEASYGYRNVIADKNANTNTNDGDKLVGRMNETSTRNLVFYCDSISDYTLRSGEICHTLNSSLRDSVIWRQTIGTDSLPTLYTKAKTVYFYEEQGAKGYTNEAAPTLLKWSLKDIVENDTVSIPVYKGSLINFGVVQPDHRHFVFKGWNTKVDGSGTVYRKDTIMVANEDLMLYTQYDMIVVMSQDDSEKISQDIPQDIPFAKVYDDGGSDHPYTAGARYVTLKAPEGSLLQLKGTVTSKAVEGEDDIPQDYLAVYDGDYAADLRNSQKLANDQAKSGKEWKHVYYSTKAGKTYDVGTLSSSGREMTIFFQSTSQGSTAYPGLDLTVTHVPVDSAVTVLGKGTEEAPYKVMTAADLKNIAAFSELKSNSRFSIQQMADIDMEGLTVTPLLNDSAGFAGHYDGNGYVIRNMRMDSYKGAAVGLFGSVSGVVERLGMENCTVKAVANDARVGALAGQLTGKGLLRNCYVAGSAIAYNDVRGVVGALVGEQRDSSRIEACYGYKNQVVGFTERSGNKRFGYIAGDLAGTATQHLVFTDGQSLCSDGQGDGANLTDANMKVERQRFAEGEICYLLNESRTDSVVWYQTIGSDSIPVLRDDHGIVTCRNDRYDNRLFITNKEELIAYAGKNTDLYLTQDIDLGEWNQKLDLRGSLDGGGHTIRYSNNSNSNGLFSLIRETGAVSHLRVEANVSTMNDFGGIAYECYGKISDCHFRGNVHVKYLSKRTVAGITAYILYSNNIDHCSVAANFTIDRRDGKLYTCCPTGNFDRFSESSTQDHWTWVDPNNTRLYAAQADSAMKVQADYPVYAKGILDVTGPYLVIGNDSLSAPDRYINMLTIKDGKRFHSTSGVTVGQITYERKGTNGAYEPWVLPFDYTIDADMLKGNVEFYYFDKDSTSNSNIVTKQITADAPYQVAANEPLAFRTTDASEYRFKMKRTVDGKAQPMTITMPSDGVGALMANTKDIARLMITYDNIAAGKAAKELAYVWNDEQADFILSDGTTSLQPFRYYLQYVDKATGHFEQWEQTDWARRQARGGTKRALSKSETLMRAPLSTMTAEGWQPIILDPRGSQTVTAEMLDDYEIYALNDIYDAADPNDPDGQQMTVAVIYEQVVEGMTLPTAVPLLVKARRADAEPLVTEEMGREIDAQLTALAEDMDEDELMSAFEESHYWCSTFGGRYDVWQLPMPEDDNILHEFGALIFADKGDDQYFHRVAASSATTLQPMSYCFTAYDPRTFENLPLANDRIEIVAVAYSEATDIEAVQGSGVKAQDTGATYNLRGQKVDDNYRGIVIKNGRKFLRR